MYFRVVDMSLGRMHFEVGLCALQFMFSLKMMDLKGSLCASSSAPLEAKLTQKAERSYEKLHLFFKLKCGVRPINDDGHSGRPYKSKMFRKKTQNKKFGTDKQSQNIGNDCQ